MKKISLFIICLVLLVFGASTTSAKQLLSRRRDGQGENNSMVASFIERLGKKKKEKKEAKREQKEKKHMARIYGSGRRLGYTVQEVDKLYNQFNNFDTDAPFL